MFLIKTTSSVGFDPVLVCDGVVLRRATVTDYGEWAALREESREHLTPWEESWTEAETSVAAFRRRLRYFERQARSAARLPLLVFRREDRVLVGGATLSNIRYGAAQTATLGYWIGKPFVRRGYGRAAIEAIVRHGFDGLGLNRIEAACQPENQPSRALLLKSGFRHEGCAREYLKINGTWRDHDLYALTAGAFEVSEDGTDGAPA
ncbi:MAG: GNAT family protein [Pseudomonadota bacterium]